MQPIDVYKYYSLLAEEIGSKHARTELGEIDREQDKDEIKQENYSVLWYFVCQFRQNDIYDRYEALGDIAKAFLGDGVKNRGLNWNETIDNTVIERIGNNETLNESQKQAIITAVSKPVSLIQGPPGTGKTRTIVEMIRTIISMGKTVAVMSCNNSALKAISEQIDKVDREHPEIESLGAKVAVLGSIEKRRNFQSIPFSEDDPSPLFSFRAAKSVEYSGFTYGGGSYRRESNICGEVFTSVYPCVISTIHSIRNCFLDGMDYRYDYVIIDEASQVPMHLGLIAADTGKHLVLVGDDKQLPPVIFEERLDILRENHPEINYEELGIYKQTGDVSFLGAASSILGGRENYVFLDKHYRCHPGIIGFCRKYVYGDRLEICTQGQGMPISVIWYEGDYGESYSEMNEDGIREYFSRVNYRQIRIFLMDEYRTLLDKIEEGKSVSILSPYRGQLLALRKAILEYNDNHGIDLNVIYNGDESDNNYTEGHEPSFELPCLTIHKSQGREFDIVYLFAVDDDNKNRQGDAPWTQKERLINVATSRAKEELHIVASVNILSSEIQEKLLGYSLRTETENNQLLFMTQLIEYAFDYYKDKKDYIENDFGFRKARAKSIFDKWNFEILDGLDYSSYYEDCLGRELSEGRVLRDRNLTFYHEMSLHKIVETSEAAREKYESVDDDIKRFVDSRQAHMDFAIVNEDGELIADIEVDGKYHYLEPQIERDKKKDDFLQRTLHVPVIRLKIDGQKNGDIPETVEDDGCDEIAFIEQVLDQELAFTSKERYQVICNTCQEGQDTEDEIDRKINELREYGLKTPSFISDVIHREFGVNRLADIEASKLDRLRQNARFMYSGQGRNSNYDAMDNAAAYVIGYMPFYLYEIWHPLSGLEASGNPINGRARILALGEGPGTATLGLVYYYSLLAKKYPNESFELDILAIEASREFCQWFEKFHEGIRTIFPTNIEVNTRIINSDISNPNLTGILDEEVRVNGDFDYLLESNMLNSFESDPTVDEVGIFNNIFNRYVKENGFAIVIEPGNIPSTMNRISRNLSSTVIDRKTDCVIYKATDPFLREIIQSRIRDNWMDERNFYWMIVKKDGDV